MEKKVNYIPAVRSRIEKKVGIYCRVSTKDLRFVILYNAAAVDKSKCPDSIKDYGTHAAMKKMKDGKHEWDYQSVKTALGL